MPGPNIIYPLPSQFDVLQMTKLMAIVKKDMHKGYHITKMHQILATVKLFFFFYEVRSFINGIKKMQ